MYWAIQLRFTLCLLVWTTAFSAGSLSAQSDGKLKIDENGNLILDQNQKPLEDSPENTTTKSSPIETKTSEDAKPETEIIQPDRGLQTPESTKPLTVTETTYDKPKPASISARVVKATRSPNPNSDLVVLLREGDRIEVLAETIDSFRIRYLIDRDFPVEAYVPREAVRDVKGGEIKPERLAEQSYTPKPQEEKVTTQVTELPQEALPEHIQFGLQGKGRSEFNLSNKEEDENSLNATKAKAGPSFLEGFARDIQNKDWLYEAGASFGRSSFGETVKTKGQTSNFLDYDMTGLLFAAQSRATRQHREWPYGFLAEYSFGFYDAEVGGTGTGVVSSSIQAQKHSLNLGGFINKDYPLKYKILLQPELGLKLNFSVLTTNQLRTDSVTNSFPVLFGYWSASPRLEFVLHSYLPYNFRISPFVGADLYYYFKELNTQSVGSSLIGTGNPKASFMNLNYGAELAWNLKSLRLENADILFKMNFSNISRKFSGNGNRAGIATEDAKSKISINDLEFGLRYLF